jgi:hypothetical protein
MNYQLDFDLNYLKVSTPTSEKHDEIFMTGFGVNELGIFEVIPWRRIMSSTVSSFTEDINRFDNESDTVYGNTITGSPTLLSAKLPGRRHLRYQIWLWIVESDNAALLREKHRFNKEGLESNLNNYLYDLRRDGFPEETRVFQAVSNNILDIHTGLQKALYSEGTKFRVFTPITKFVDCNYFLRNPSDLYITDFEPGEYIVDNEINSSLFDLSPSFLPIFSGENNSEFPTRYIFSNYWKLTVSGTPGLPVHP